MHFELRKWVCISDDFDVNLIVEKLVETRNSEMEALKSHLHQQINGKMYFQNIKLFTIYKIYDVRFIYSFDYLMIYFVVPMGTHPSADGLTKLEIEWVSFPFQLSFLTLIWHLTLVLHKLSLFLHCGQVCPVTHQHK